MKKKNWLIVLGCLIVVLVIGVIVLFNIQKSKLMKSWYVTYDNHTYYLKFDENNKLTSGYLYNEESMESDYKIVSNKIVIDGEKRSYSLNDNQLSIFGMTFYDDEEESMINQVLVEDENDLMDYDTSRFTKFTQDEMIEKFKSGDEFFVMFATESCYYCRLFRPDVIKSLDEYDYDMYYVDSAEVYDYFLISDLDDNFRSSLATPVVYHIKDGKVIDHSLGAVFYLEYIAFLRNNDVSLRSN